MSSKEVDLKEIDLKEIELFLDGYYSGNEVNTDKKDSTAAQVGIGVGVRGTVNRYSEIIKEDMTMFERLKYDSLQGSPGKKHGDAAEVLGVRDVNKQNILSGSSDRMELSPSKTDPFTDVLLKDSIGNIIERGQVKYYETPRQTMESLSEGKYNVNNAKYAPPEQVDQIKQMALDKAKTLRSQAKQLRQKGDVELAKQKLSEAKNYEHTAEHVKGLPRTRDEAIQASENEFSRVKVTGQAMLQDFHESGVKGAQVGAAVSGTLSGVQNIHAAIKGDKEIGEAIVDTAIDTAKGACVSYAVSFSSTAVKAGAQKVGEKIGSKTLQAFANSAKGPAIFITSTIEVGKSLKKYMDGELGTADLFIELGEKGTGILCGEVGAVVGEACGVAAGTAIGAFIGTVIIPGLGTGAGALAGAKIGAIVGPIVGSMVGYMVGTQIYQSVHSLISQYDSEKYIRMKAIYEHAYQRMKKERLELERQIDLHFANRKAYFSDCFKQMENAIFDNDIEAVNNRLADILGAFEETLQFKNFKEFDDFMLDDGSVLRI